MPRSRPSKSLYQRGRYQLHKRPDRANYDIIWYDAAAGRQRGRSAGTGDLDAAKEALDRLYLQSERGQAVCPTCNRPWDEKRRFALVQAMMDYDLSRQGRPSYPAIHASLGHVHAYLEETGQTRIACEDVSQDWIERFEAWARKVPVVSPAGNFRARAAATVNNAVIYLAAAINAAHARRDTLFPAAFKPRAAETVNRTPEYRAGVAEIAAMFAYGLEYPVKRLALLNFLRISVVTLIRPEHAHYVSADPADGQWNSAAGTLNLLPKGEVQTKKRRPIVPVARQARAWLDASPEMLVQPVSIKSSWTRMQSKLGLPGAGQAGPKLIRRSMATLIRDRLDPRDIAELEIFLGHRASSRITDLYAPSDPAYLARARLAIEAIIDEIEAAAPGAFHRTDTATGAEIITIGAR